MLPRRPRARRARRPRRPSGRTPRRRPGSHPPGCGLVEAEASGSRRPSRSSSSCRSSQTPGRNRAAGVRRASRPRPGRASSAPCPGASSLLRVRPGARAARRARERDFEREAHRASLGISRIATAYPPKGGGIRESRANNRGRDRPGDPFARRLARRVHGRALASRAPLALAVGEELALAERELDLLGHAALYHDIGKAAIPDEILLKPATLTEDEWLLMRSHSDEGARMVAEAGVPADAVRAIRHHHEHFDGTRLPRRACRRGHPGRRPHHPRCGRDRLHADHAHLPARAPRPRRAA